jgi:hypothetical protein
MGDALRRHSSHRRQVSTISAYNEWIAETNWPSIIFIHGLRGHRTKTWTKDGVCWPNKLLSKEQTLSHVRILAFGYDATGNDILMIHKVYCSDSLYLLHVGLSLQVGLIYNECTWLSNYSARGSRWPLLVGRIPASHIVARLLLQLILLYLVCFLSINPLPVPEIWSGGQCGSY